MQSETMTAGGMTIARHVLPKGFDSAPLYVGLPDDRCPCQHWCYLVRGSLRYHFTDGTELLVTVGSTFHVRPGHLADVLEDSELIEVTRADEYAAKNAHLERRRADLAADRPSR